MNRAWLLGVFIVGLSTYCVVGTYFGVWGSKAPTTEQIPSADASAGDHERDRETPVVRTIPVDSPAPFSPSGSSADDAVSVSTDARISSETFDTTPIEEVPGGSLTTTPEMKRNEVLAHLAQARGEKDVLKRARGLSKVLQSGLLSKEEEESAYGDLLVANQAGVLSPRCNEGFFRETVHEGGDSLWKIAKRVSAAGHPFYACGLLQLVNSLPNDRIKVGQQLKIPNHSPSIVLSKSRHVLWLVLDDFVLRRFPIGVGRENKTPEGEFEIGSREKEPTWYPPGGGSIPFGDPSNVLGTRWLGFKERTDFPGASSFGFHGTWDDQTIGGDFSEGCIRMLNRDIEELFDLVECGARVSIQP